MLSSSYYTTGLQLHDAFICFSWVFYGRYNIQINELGNRQVHRPSLVQFYHRFQRWVRHRSRKVVWSWSFFQEFMKLVYFLSTVSSGMTITLVKMLLTPSVETDSISDLVMSNVEQQPFVTLKIKLSTVSLVNKVSSLGQFNWPAILVPVYDHAGGVDLLTLVWLWYKK